MKIKILKMVACPPWNLSALPNDVIEIDEKQGISLIEAERAEATEDEVNHEIYVETEVETNVETETEVKTEATETEAKPKKDTKKK